jgi:excisionase family DNA binding protein
VDWIFAPEWLAVEQACELSGWDPGSLLEIMAQGGVDVDEAGLIEKQSLYEFQETLAEVLHWDG